MLKFIKLEFFELRASSRVPGTCGKEDRYRLLCRTDSCQSTDYTTRALRSPLNCLLILILKLFSFRFIPRKNAPVNFFGQKIQIRIFFEVFQLKKCARILNKENKFGVFKGKQGEVEANFFFCFYHTIQGYPTIIPIDLTVRRLK